MNQNLKGVRVQRVPTSKPAASGHNQRSIPAPVTKKSKNVSHLVPARGKCQKTKSKASFRSPGVRKHCHYEYLTLLDVMMMNTPARPASRILPTEKLVPNSYHQSFHVARWRKWLNETPQVQI